MLRNLHYRCHRTLLSLVREVVHRTFLSLVLEVVHQTLVLLVLFFFHRTPLSLVLEFVHRTLLSLTLDVLLSYTSSSPEIVAFASKEGSSTPFLLFLQLIFSHRHRPL